MCQPIGKLISPTEPPRLITGGYLRFFDFNWSFPRPHKKPSDPKQARRRARSSEVGTEFFMSSFCFLEHLASVQDVSTYWGGFCEAFWELVPTAVSSCHFQGIQSTIRVSWTPTEQVGFKVGAASHPHWAAAHSHSVQWGRGGRRVLAKNHQDQVWLAVRFRSKLTGRKRLAENA
jgi:hypothetical protein